MAFLGVTIMRTLSTLASLLVGLAFIFWAPTAKADCPHGTKFDHPHCNGAGAGSLTFVVMDCADLSCSAPPKRVGTVVGIPALGLVVVQAQFEDLLGEIRNVGLCVTELQIQDCGGGDPVWFSELNCGGQAWTRIASERFFAPTFEPATVVSDTADPNVRALYVPSDDTVVNDTSVSRADTQGCRSPLAQAFSGVAAEKIVSDLHTDFPPPYTLENQ